MASYVCQQAKPILSFQYNGPTLDSKFLTTRSFFLWNYKKNRLTTVIQINLIKKKKNKCIALKQKIHSYHSLYTIETITMQPNAVVTWSANQVNNLTTHLATTKSKNPNHSWPGCLNSFRSFVENNLQASILKSIAAANATKAAASSVHATCCRLTSTSGLPHFPTRVTVDDITKPRCNMCDHNPDPISEKEPDPESKLVLGVLIGEGPMLLSIVNFPPFVVLSVLLVRVMASWPPSRKWSNR